MHISENSLHLTFASLNSYHCLIIRPPNYQTYWQWWIPTSTIGTNKLFQEYQYYFEDVMSSFLTNEGFSVQEFYSAVQRELESLPSSRADETYRAHLHCFSLFYYRYFSALLILISYACKFRFASVLLSALDFGTFCEMMNDVKVCKTIWLLFYPFNWGLSSMLNTIMMNDRKAEGLSSVPLWFLWKLISMETNK